MDQTVEQAKAAVNLLLQDVKAELGAGALEAVDVLVGREAELREALPRSLHAQRWHLSLADLHIGHGLLVSGDQVVTLPTTNFLDAGWEYYVVCVAEVFQDAFREPGLEPRWPRRVHEYHAMVPQVVEGVASWKCPLGEGEPIPIGAAGEAGGKQGDSSQNL